MNPIILISYFFSILLFLFVAFKSYILPIPIKTNIIIFCVFIISRVIYVLASKQFLRNISFKLLFFSQAIENFFGFIYADKFRILHLKGKQKHNTFLIYRLLTLSFWTFALILALPLIIYKDFLWNNTLIYYIAVFILIFSFLWKVYFFKLFLKKADISMFQVFSFYVLLIIFLITEILGLYNLTTLFLSTISLQRIIVAWIIANFISLFLIPNGLGVKELVFASFLFYFYRSFGLFAFIAILWRFYEFIFYFLIFIFLKLFMINNNE